MPVASNGSSGEGDHAGDTKDADDGKKGQSLRWGLVVGGESMDEQFEMISSNPDVYVTVFNVKNFHLTLLTVLSQLLVVCSISLWK